MLRELTYVESATARIGFSKTGFQKALQFVRGTLETLMVECSPWMLIPGKTIGPFQSFPRLRKVSSHCELIACSSSQSRLMDCMPPELEVLNLYAYGFSGMTSACVLAKLGKDVIEMMEAKGRGLFLPMLQVACDRVEVELEIAPW